VSTAGDFPCDGAPLALTGAAGPIEALAACPPPERAASATAIVCHPHPLHGGTMHNKVVHTLARGFTDLGLRALRFNFRGVGASAGVHDYGQGETDDLLAVLDWVRSRRPRDELWLAGFSFGSFVALRAAARYPVARLVAVAPPVSLYDFTALAPRAPCLVIQGEADEVVSAPAVIEWARRFEPSVTLVRLPEVGHFFHGRLNELRALMADRLGGSVPRG
jgi:uncharacterized protein